MLLGTSTIGSMLYWIEEALANTKEGDITKALQTPMGWVILKVHGIRRSRPGVRAQAQRGQAEEAARRDEA